jgi:hypothetical protein
MTGSSMATGFDMTESDLRKVGDSPWGATYLFEVLYSAPWVFSMTSAFSLWYFY